MAGDLTDEQLIKVAEALAAINEQAAELAKVKPDLSTIEQIGQSLVETFEAGERLDRIVSNIATNLLQGFGSAVEEAFGAFVSGSESAGQAFKNAMLGAVASVARAQGSMFAAEALAALGRGLLGNPAAFAAAAKFTAASIAMFALAGSLSAMAGGGGGGRSGAGAGSAETQREQLEDQRGAAEIVIQGGLLDMSDPRQADALSSAINDLDGRRVTIRGA